MDNKRILLTDDQEIILQVLKRALLDKYPDYQVVTALNGSIALDYILKQPFDLIVTDFNMPYMDGLELIESIRYAQPNARLIMLTGYGHDGVEEEAKRLQVYRYLTKPVALSTFCQAVEEALQDVVPNRPKLFALTDDQQQEVTLLLNKLKVDVSARCIFLTQASGETILRCGDAGTLPVENIAALLGGSMSTILEVGCLLDKEADAINLAFHEGQKENLYAVNVGRQFLMIIIINRSSYNSRLGSVWHYAQQAAMTLRRQLDQMTSVSSQGIFDQFSDEVFEAEIDKLVSV